MAKDLLRNIIVALIYIALALPSILLGEKEGLSAPFWPASGFALFALLHIGYKIIPGIFLGVVAANYGMAITAITPPDIEVSILALVGGAGNVTEAIIVGLVVGMRAPFTILTNVKTAFLFLGGAILGTFVSATLGNLPLLFAPQTTLVQFQYDFIFWWLSNLIGIIVIVPLLLSFTQISQFKISKLKVIELLAFIAALVFVELALKQKPMTPALYGTLIFISIPIILFFTYRYPKPVAFIGIFILYLLSTYSGISTAPPFNIDEMSLRYLSIQQFQLVLASTILIASAIVDERKTAFKKLAQGYISIEQNIKERTSELEESNQLLLQEFAIREEIEQQLIEKEELLNQTQQMARIGSWEYIVETNTITWSEETYRILDLPSNHDISSIEDLALMSGDYRGSVLKTHLLKCINSQKSLQELVSIKTTLGKQKTVLMKFRPVIIGGKAIKVTGIIQDLTDLIEKERELAESEEKYRSLFDTNIDSIVVFDIETLKIVDINPAFSQQYGYSRSEILGQSYATLTTENEKTLNQILQHPQEGNSREGIRQHKRKNGELFYIEASLTPFNFRGQQICYAISHDITQRVKTEQELAERENRFRSFFESNLVGFAEISIDGEWLNFNDKLCEILGIAGNALKGTTWMEITHPDDLIKENKLVHKVLTRQAENYFIEKRFINGLGAFVPTRVYISPLRTNRGNIRSYICIVENITDQKEAEAQLIDSRKKLEMAQQIGHVGSWSLNLVTKRMTWSDEVYRIFGVKPKEFHPSFTTFKNIIDGSDHPFLDNLVKKAEESELVKIKSEKKITRPSGEVRYISMNISTQTTHEGTPLELIGSIADITDLKTTQLELETANSSKEKMLSIIAHDLRSPLASVKQIVDMLAAEWQIYDMNTISGLLYGLRDSTNETFNLLENLLGWARAQKGELVFAPRHEDVCEVIKDTTMLLKSVAVSKDITIKELLPKSATAHFDHQMVKLILRNLLSNAIKFTPSGGLVTIHLVDNPTFIEIQVTDSGIGMDKTTIAKILDKQTHYTTPGTQDEKGSGLGLKLAIEFAALNGGELWVKSKIDEGTTFHFTLPK